MRKKKKPSRRSPKRKSSQARRQPRARKSTSRKRRTGRKAPARGRPAEAIVFAVRPKGATPNAAGQAGDIQGLPSFADADSESIEELVEEGQAYEAGIIEGVEESPDADEAEVTTKETPQDDVPREYRDGK